jgi:hypothetical protein
MLGDKRNSRHGQLSLTLMAVLVVPPLSRAQDSLPFRNTIDAVPPGWDGTVFQLSKDYPTTLQTDPMPWKAFKFKTQQKEYLQAVLTYAREGNEEVNWRVQDNKVRKWYHAPGLLDDRAPTPAGREFIRGLTRERTSLPKELHSSQDKHVSNWAVGFYNPIAAYTIGKVWANPSAPDTSAVKFDDGAVAFKLLFSSASVDQVPFLADSMKWQANIDVIDVVPPSTARQPREVLLLQVDVAVRDIRADDTTGWVFGTFMYQNDAPGTTPLERLVPVGLMWGNDPDLTKNRFDAGERPVQTWLNANGVPATKSPHFGWSDRLNGPVDNPKSSCLSCHARAVRPYVPANTFPSGITDPDDPVKKFFTNTKAGEVYEGAPSGTLSLDYSLQLAVGVRLFPGSGPSHPLEKTAIQSSQFRGGEPEDTTGTTPEGSDSQTPADASGAAGKTLWPWVVGAIVILIAVVLVALWIGSSRKGAATR